MHHESNPFFLKKKYDLHATPEVAQAAKRKEILTGEPVSQDADVRIQNYLDRFTEIIERKDLNKKERGIEAFKRLMHQKAVITPENVPEAAFLLEQRIARELGHGTIEITDDFREKKTQEIISNQTQSLDKWIDYLSSPDAQYPDWAKYWAFRSILEMGKMEKNIDEETGKETASFKKRTKNTVSSFAPLNPRALAMTVTAITNKVSRDRSHKKEQSGTIQNLSKKLGQKEFESLLSTENFSKIYTQFLIELPAYSVEGLQETRGEWKVYPQHSDPQPLVDSLDGYPLEWCTAGMDTARSQLQGGDFHVYYSLDESGEPKIPRVAIRMEQDRIAEVRGIAPNQHLDPYIGDEVQKKMTKFPDGKAYEKKADDMKQLTAIEKKVYKKEDLTKDDLIFLYEIQHKIEGFGYQRDPRIGEVRLQRNPESDMPIVFECDPSQIARSPQEVNEHTKAYVGPLFPGIFKVLGHLEHIYTKFPEGRIQQYSIEIGGQTNEQLETTLNRVGCKISDYARYMMKHKEFEAAIDPEQVDLVRLQVGDLFGDQYAHMTDDIYKKADQLGLELCPAEVGPHLRLKLTEQPMNEWFRIAMKQITAPGGFPGVFGLEHDDGGLWLNYSWAKPTNEWFSEHEFVFRLRK